MNGCIYLVAIKFLEGLQQITTIQVNNAGFPNFRVGSKNLFTNDFCVGYDDLENFGIEYYSEIEPTLLGKFIYSINNYGALIECDEEPFFKVKDWLFKDLVLNYVYEENKPVSVDDIALKFNLNIIEVFRFAFELDFLSCPVWKRAENGTILLYPISFISENDLKILEIDSDSINSFKFRFEEVKLIELSSHANIIVKFIESAGRKVSIELISKELGLDIFYLLRFIFTYNLWGHHIKMEVAGKDILLYKYSRKTRHTMV